MNPGKGPSAHSPCPQTLAAVLTALPRSSPAELTISALSLALLVPVKELNVRFRDRLPTPIPGEVVMVRMAVRAGPLPAQTLLSCGKWRLPPPGGVQRGHGTEGQLTLTFPGLLQEDALIFHSPPRHCPTSLTEHPLHLLEFLLPSYSAPLRSCWSQHLL